MTRNASRAQPLIQIRGLKIEGYSDDKWHPIIKGIDLDLKRGEVLGLIGESGAGKSTLGLAAMGYTKPGCRISAGTFMFDGKDLAHASQEELRKMWGSQISYVAQSASASFNPAHHLMDQVVESAVNHGVMAREAAETDAKDLFKRLQLPNPDTIGARYPHQVSGGQLQRAMTAMAMSCRPDLIVFDEPTTALDVTTQVEVLASMRRIVEEFNTAAIYITHDLAVVAQMAHRIMVLRYGNLVEESETRSMLKAAHTRLYQVAVGRAQLEKPEEKSATLCLSISNVDASYSGVVKVLENVTVRLPRGKTVSVVGESGSGKSTLARAITGLLPPSKGRIEFNGKALPAKLKDRDRDTLRRIQMIYQSADTALNPRQRVRDIIGRPLEFYLGLKGKAQRRQDASQLLQGIELDEDFIDRFPGEMSGGQKQRISIARALGRRTRHHHLR